MDTDKDLGQELLNRGIKPSYHRMRVLKYLKENKNHPTADQIFQDLQKELPTLSKATIYNTMNLFVSENLAQAISIGGNETRYDITVEDHGHFKCKSCGEVYDFTIDMDGFKPAELEGFNINDKSVYFKGKCARCLSKI